MGQKKNRKQNGSKLEVNNRVGQELCEETKKYLKFEEQIIIIYIIYQQLIYHHQTS